MQLQVHQLKTFLDKAANIAPSASMQFNDHILIEKGRACKTNLSSSCSVVIDGGEKMLLDQQTLSAAVKAAKGDTLTIKIGKQITISDGVFKMSQPVVDANLYPKMPEAPDGEGVELTQEILDALFICKSFTDDNENGGAFRMVHMKDHYIAATDKNKLYYESFDKKLPNVIFDVPAINMLNKIGVCTLSHDSQRYYFTSSEVTFSFAKTEDITPNFEGLIARTEGEGVSVDIDKREILSFCDLVNNTGTSKITMCDIDSTGYLFKDADKPVSWPAKPGNVSFRFNAKVFAPACKAMPLELSKSKIVLNMLVCKEGNATFAFVGQV